MAIGSTKVVQVTNIAPQATKDQMQALFGYLGKIEDIRLYPTIRDVSCPVQSRICYIKFMDSNTVGIAQHMTNTVFIDRALIVIPVQSGEIPDEYYALEMTRNGAIVPGLHLNEPKLPPHVVNSVQGTGSDQVIMTTDPQLDSNNLPPYPSLPVTFDSTKIEETRRTVTVLNIDHSTKPEDILNFFSTAGEIKYLRPAKRSSDEEPLYLIEFTDQPSVLNALKLSGETFNEKIIEVQHSTQSIVKPQAKSNEAAQKEIEEAMSRFKEAQNMINATIEPVIGMLTKDKRGSRRSRSRSRGRRRKSRSRSRRRSRSRPRRRSHSRSRRSRSRDKKRRSRSKRRSTSRSRRSKSRSRSRRSRSKSTGRKRSSRGKSKDRKSKERKKSRDRKDRDKSKDRTRAKSKDRDKSKDREKSKDKEKKSEKESSVDVAVEKKRSRSRSKNRSRSRDRKKKDRKRSRSRGSRRRSVSPKRKKRSRSRSKDRKRDKSDKKERKDREKDRRTKDRSRSRSKPRRNYDEEERGYEGGSSRGKIDDTNEKESDNMDISNSP